MSVVVVLSYLWDITPRNCHQQRQLRYTVTEMECLAVVRGVEHFEVYLLGKEFVVQTDHRALQFLQTSCHLNGRLTRWALRLQEFSFSIKYRPGSKHQNADGFSRQAWPDSEQKLDDLQPVEDDSDLEEGEMSGSL